MGHTCPPLLVNAALCQGTRRDLCHGPTHHLSQATLCSEPPAQPPKAARPHLVLKACPCGSFPTNDTFYPFQDGFRYSPYGHASSPPHPPVHRASLPEALSSPRLQLQPVTFHEALTVSGGGGCKYSEGSRRGIKRKSQPQALSGADGLREARTRVARHIGHTV